MNSAAVGLGETPTKQRATNGHLKLDDSSAVVQQDIDESSNSGGKRLNYLSWPDYFMSIACLSAQRSKDPNTQVGACIVNDEKKIVGIGYNGMPTGIDDDALPWGKVSNDPLDTKYPYVCHAEMNAIMNKNSADVKECTLYSAMFPCNECAKLIIQAGIRTVVYMRDKPDKPEMQASKRLFDLVGVAYRQFTTKTKYIRIALKEPEEGECDVVTDS